MDNKHPFFVKTTSRPTKPGCWNYLDVDIYQRLEDGSEVKVGSYERNYSIFGNTFHPFERDGKWYALYSPHYTCTRVMSLPDCKDIGGEKSDAFGFCPTGYYIPRYKLGSFFEHDGKQIEYRIYDDAEYGIEYDNMKDQPWQYADWALICGCVWGDDQSWKIQYIDLSKAHKGKIKRYPKFGYIELLGDENTLRDSVIIDEETEYIKISCTQEFSLKNE